METFKTLRIDCRTIIRVPEHKCTKKYAEEYRKARNINPHIKSGRCYNNIGLSSQEKEDIIKRHKNGETYKAISKDYDVSYTTIRRLIADFKVIK